MFDKCCDINIANINQPPHTQPPPTIAKTYPIIPSHRPSSSTYPNTQQPLESPPTTKSLQTTQKIAIKTNTEDSKNYPYQKNNHCITNHPKNNHQQPKNPYEKGKTTYKTKSNTWKENPQTKNRIWKSNNSAKKMQQPNKSSSGDQNSHQQNQNSHQNPICRSAVKSDFVRETKGGRRCGVDLWVALIDGWCQPAGGTGRWMMPVGG